MSDLWITRYTFLSRSRPSVKFQLYFRRYNVRRLLRKATTSRAPFRRQGVEWRHSR